MVKRLRRIISAIIISCMILSAFSGTNISCANAAGADIPGAIGNTAENLNVSGVDNNAYDIVWASGTDPSSVQPGTKKQYENEKENAKANRNTVDMLMDDIQEVNDQISETSLKVEELNQAITELDRDKQGQLNDADRVFKEVVDGCFPNDVDYLNILNKFNQDKYIADTNPAMKDFYMSGAYEGFNARVPAFIEDQKKKLTSLEDQLLNKVSADIEVANAKKMAQNNGRGMTRNEKLKVATDIIKTIKKRYDSGLKAIENDPQMTEVYKANKEPVVNELVTLSQQYTNLKTSIENAEIANTQRVSVQTSIGMAMNISRSDLSKTYGLDYQIAGDLGKPGQEARLRNRVKEYIKAKHYDRLSVADFNAKIINKRGAQHRTRDIYPDLLQYETDKSIVNAEHQLGQNQNQLEQNQPQVVNQNQIQAGVNNVQPQDSGQGQPQGGVQNPNNQNGPAVPAPGQGQPQHVNKGPAPSH